MNYMTDDIFIALIYTRVSSITQKTNGSGNESQETRCRENAKYNNWVVERVFEDAFTGAGDFMNRPAMRELIKHIQNNSNKRYVVIFDDLKRLSRDTGAFLGLVSLFKALNVKLECLNYKFEDTPEGEFVATILAAQGQLERKQNARQVVQKTEAHLINGDWPYKPPAGYIAVKVPTQKIKVCVSNGEKGKGIKEGITGFLNGRFKTVTDLANHLGENKFIANTTKNARFDKTKAILRNIFYAGYIHRPEKGVNMVRGKQEIMISLEDYHKVQEKLKKEERGEKCYQVYRDEYELRQIARCSSCSKKLISYKAKGRTKYYNYYMCKTVGCAYRNKNIATEDVHNHLYRLLHMLEANDKIIGLGVEAYNRAIARVMSMKKINAEDIEKEILDIDVQTNVLVDNIAKLTSAIAIRGIEAKIEELDVRKKILTEREAKVYTANEKSRTALSEMTDFLKNPYKIWNICNIQQKRTLYKYIFSEDFYYDHKNQGRTILPSPLYSYNQEFKGLNENNPTSGGGIFYSHSNCARSWIRTRDRSSISRVLYQLS